MPDAPVIEAFFNAPIDPDGLDALAEVMARKSKPTEPPPSGEPWRTLYITLQKELQNGADHDSAWHVAIEPYPVNIQFELTSLARAAMQDILDQDQASTSRKRIKTKQYLAAFKKLDYRFALNQTDNSIWVEHKKQNQRLDDVLFSEVYRCVADSGNFTQADTEHCINVAASRNAFHPVKDYLKSLAWDGAPHIQTLADHFVDREGIFALWLRKWLIGAIARVFRAGTQNAMLVLDGPQNIGKSTFTRWLCPLADMYVESPISPDNKDDSIKLISHWVWEVTELGSTVRKSDIEALKGFLTTERVTVRKPYGHYPIHKPALASFIGTINNSGGFLNDPTGSRRFNVCTLTGIDWNYQKMDIHQVWAEVCVAYLAGESWTLNADEQKIRDQINDGYQVEDPVEAAILKLFEIDATRRDWWIATYDIVKQIEDPYLGGIRSGSTLSTARAVAQALVKLGCQPVKKNYGIRGYIGVRQKP